jgi:xanthine dehydrogenase YagS FAD-binding subunit
VGAAPETFDAALRLELADAVPLPGNGFKIELTRRVAVAVLSELARSVP